MQNKITYIGIKLDKKALSTKISEAYVMEGLKIYKAGKIELRVLNTFKKTLKKFKKAAQDSILPPAIVFEDNKLSIESGDEVLEYVFRLDALTQ